MRQEISIYKCDRCSEVVTFRDESPDFQVRALNDSGWRRIAISSMPEPGIPLTKIGGLRDLCRLCYIGLVAYIEMGESEFVFDSDDPQTSNDSQSSEM